MLILNETLNVEYSWRSPITSVLLALVIIIFCYCSYLPTKGALWSKTCSYIRKLTLVSLDHPKTFNSFRSYSAVVAEQQRQIFEKANYVIHPVSQFSLGWNSVIAVINLLHMVCTTLRLCYILEPAQPTLHSMDDAILALHIICLLDVLVKFNTGFEDEVLFNIVLKKQRIACLPMAYVLLVLKVQCTRCILAAHVLPLIRTTRLRGSLKNIDTFIMIFTRSYIWRRAIHHILLFVVTMHFSNCVVYSSPVLSYYWNGKMAEGHHSFFLNSTDTDLTKFSISHRYQKALFLCLSSFFGTGMSMYKVYSPDEYIVHSVIILYASMFMIYTTVLLLNIYIISYNPVTRYYALMNQLETYMRHRQFPKPLKKRIRMFYDYKFVEQYYKEDRILGCLSDQLRHEITLHTCHKFVSKVKMFEGLPADVMGVILSHFEPEVYLANDLVVRAGDIGHCMYFIAYGTVAVYSLKGAEICHLEDGEHFGAIALLMKDNKRVATVVAVEISHLYRLDDVHFRQYIMMNPILRERIEVLAAKRMHETVVFDERFRKQQQRKQEQRNFATTSDPAKERN